jgi:hypothetical protein
MTARPTGGHPAAPLAVSRHRASRLLGIRLALVAELVRRRLLYEVPWGAGRRRIPLESVEALARSGWRLDGPAPRQRRARRGRCDPDAIRRLDVETLTPGGRP